MIILILYYLPPTYPRSPALSPSQIYLLNCLCANNLESYWCYLQAHDNGARVTNYWCCIPEVSDLLFLSSYELPIAPLPRVGPWRPIFHSCWNLAWLNLMTVSYLNGCNSHTKSRSQCFMALLPVCQLLYSFCPCSKMLSDLGLGEVAIDDLPTAKRSFILSILTSYESLY